MAEKLFMNQMPQSARRKKANQRYGSVRVTTVLRVNDGDTFYCNVNHFHPLLGNNIGIRLRGLNCPEMSSKIPAVQKRAVEARLELVHLLHNAKVIMLVNPQRGKYFRIIADVEIDGKSVGTILLEKKLARFYDGNGPRSWTIENLK